MLSNQNRPFLDLDFAARFISSIFTTASNFMDISTRHSLVESRIFDRQIQGAFKRLSPYSYGIVTVECSCGNVFVANPLSLVKGLTHCPCCHAKCEIRNKAEYLAARDNAISTLIETRSGRKVDNVQNGVITILDTSNGIVHKLDAISYLEDYRLPVIEDIAAPDEACMNEFRKLQSLYLRPYGIRMGVPICDSLLFFT